MEKDFSTISPSAISLLMLKAYAHIPFARQAATAMFGSETVAAYAEKLQNPAVAYKLLHFENRYKTIDEALQKTGITNIIELSSGLSFRGLQLCGNQNIHYIDTDLPNMVAMKKDLLANMATTLPAKYTVAALNVLDGELFASLVCGLPLGGLAIINEGLLVYLDLQEKQRLCGVIHSILKPRGGCWITGDIYIRRGPKLLQDEQTRQFLDAHNVEQNKFTDYGEAEQFFASCGFCITDRLIKYSQPLAASNYLGTEKVNEVYNGSGNHVRETWVLKAV